MHPAVEELRKLPVAEKLRVIEELWDDIGRSNEPVPLPEGALHEAKRRRDDMVSDPQLGLTHEEVWKRIREARDG